MQLATPPGTDEPALWQRLRGSGDAAAREALLAIHLPYARVVAASYYARRYHDEIEFGDYLQFASLGMLEALDRYEPQRGVQFRTFAARRMHGAILSGIERLTEKQQQIAARQRLRRERLQDLKAAAPDEGLAGSPQDAARLLRFVAEVGIGLALCWMLEGTGLVDQQQEAPPQPFYQSAALRQLRERLQQAIDTLPPLERTVIRSHYLQELPFAEVAASLQLTRGRISQLHRQALQRLRNLVRDQAGWNATF